MKISTILLTFNSQATIARTLQSAMKVSSDIHVVDSFSTDATVKIARGLSAQVVQHSFENYGAQRNWAIDNLPLKCPWQLHLDADEYLTDELIDEIRRLQEKFPQDVDGFFLPRKMRFLNRILEHGGLYPTWHMRLFRTGKGRCENRHYDQHFILSGKPSHFRHPMIDDVRMPLTEWTARHNRWSDAEVEEIFAPNAKGVIKGNFFGSKIERIRALRQVYYALPRLLRPFLLFIYRYFLRLGFLDGAPGLIYIVLQTFWYRFLVDAKYYERINDVHHREC